MSNKIQKKWASYSYRTATTVYPCYVPILGDSTGAGRMRLAHSKCRILFIISEDFYDNYFHEWFREQIH